MALLIFSGIQSPNRSLAPCHAKKVISSWGVRPPVVISLGYSYFNSLNENDKHQLVWGEGILLVCRKEGNYKYLLYQIDSFYVELKYNVTNKIEPCKSFTSTNFLEPYLTQISLSSIF